MFVSRDEESDIDEDDDDDDDADDEKKQQHSGDAALADDSMLEPPAGSRRQRGGEQQWHNHCDNVLLFFSFPFHGLITLPAYTQKKTQHTTPFEHFVSRRESSQKLLIN